MHGNTPLKFLAVWKHDKSIVCESENHWIKGEMPDKCKGKNLNQSIFFFRNSGEITQSYNSLHNFIMKLCPLVKKKIFIEVQVAFFILALAIVMHISNVYQQVKRQHKKKPNQTFCYIQNFKSFAISGQSGEAIKILLKLAFVRSF